MATQEKGRWNETHERVVRVASERFRKQGLDGIGIAALMAEAGLTHGGFYAHFASKDALVDEAVAYAFEALYGDSSGPKAPRDDLAGLIDWYLSPAHRDHPAKGCPLAALASELARRPKSTRGAFADAAQIAMDKMTTALSAVDRGEEKVALCYAVISQLLGALQLSRIVVDKTVSDTILEIGKRAARRISGLDPVSPAATGAGGHS